MKVKRFVAQDMRQAIRMVRNALGEDAVILSNKSVDGGVELMAAVDLEPSTITDHIDQRIAPSPTSGERRATSNLDPAADPLAKMHRELQSMRRFMENEWSELSWRDLGERRPVGRENLRRLISLGIAPDLARGLVDQTGEPDDVEAAWRQSLYLLADQIEQHDHELLDRGGVVALVGPTGVGKTTTLAKLAAKFALRHGHRHVALVSIDNFRIGARDQLHTYGRILNVPVRTAANVAEFDTVLDELADRQLVLIDTAGMGVRNDRFDEQLNLLGESQHEITRLLALSTTTGEHSLERAVNLFQLMRPEACLLTKLDEAATLDSALSTVVRHRLPVAFLTDGQRVPEDLHIARSHPLVNRAVELMEQQPIEPDSDHMAFACAEARSHAQL